MKKKDKLKIEVNLYVPIRENEHDISFGDESKLQTNIHDMGHFTLKINLCV